MLFAMMTVLVCYLCISGAGGVRRIHGNRSISQIGDRGPNLYAGDQVKVDLQLQLPGFMPLPYIIVQEQLKRHTGEMWSFEESVAEARRSSELHYQTPPLERGRYMFVETNCKSQDIFGLVEHSGSFRIDGEFRILPRTVFIPGWRLYSRNSRLAGPETAVALSFRETTQINGVRDYVYGDRISRIHWNATAKTGVWKSKEFEHESLPKTILVLDAHSVSYINQQDKFELAVSVAASLLEYGARERIHMGLCSLSKHTGRFHPVESDLSHQMMLHHLVDVEADGYGSYTDQLDAVHELFPRGSYFILISPLADERALAMMRWAKMRNMLPHHIHVGAPSERSGIGLSWQSALKSNGMQGLFVSSLSELPSALGGGRR